MTELFKGFEVNWEPRGLSVMKLVAWSVLVHVLSIAILMHVPAVRNVLSIAGLVADTTFVDKDYERTQIGDDVQFVQLSNAKFRYPDGYWAMDGQPGLVMPPPVLPPPPSQIIVQSQPTGPVQAPTPALPVASATPAPLVAISPTPSATGTPTQAVAQANASPSPSGDAKTDKAQTELDKVAKDNNLTLPKEGEINKKALKDFAAYANDLKNQGKLDLNKPFEIVIEAELDGQGKLKDPKFTKKEGDPNLVDLFGRMVGALNDSGFLVYLKPIDNDNPGTKVVFTIKQGETEVLASVESEVSSDNSARLLAKGFNAALVIGAESRAGKDEEVLLRNTSAEPNGKKIIFNFTMPRQAMVDFIKKQLAAG